MKKVRNIQHSTFNLQRRSVSAKRPRGVALLFVLLLLGMTGCRRDMFLQPSEKPLERSEFFRDNKMASRPLPAYTVAREHLNDDEAFYSGTMGTNLVTTFPFPVTREVLVRGQERFDIYCAPCHGRTGDGNGMVPQRGYSVPPSYHIDRLRTAPVGHFFDVISRGYGVMYSYGSRVEPVDRWAIVAYIRALQLSHTATISDVPEQELSQLEAAK
jgi:mono/diheme cytochrome c family protein